MKLYTTLSTLSTVTHYLCRTLKSVSIAKVRFVTYDKSIGRDKNFDFSA